MGKIKTFNGNRLRSARLYRNMTIKELAEKTGVTKQAISQFENGLSSPSFETLLQLVNALKFPRDYFYEDDKIEIEIGNTYFRALLTTNKKDRISQIEKTKILGKIYSFLNIYIEFPNQNVPEIDIEEKSIEEIAQAARCYWGLGNEPIPDMVYLLEKNGIIVTSFSTGDRFIDAFSQKQKINDKEQFFVILGEDKESVVRRQFSAAHELGHILLHNETLDIEQISRQEFREMESEANEFASAFLLPAKSFMNDLIYPNNLEFYIELKKKWKVSISAMIIRAYKLKAITYNQYQYLMRQISRKGWKTKEPLDDILQPSRPMVLRKSIDMLISNGVLTGEEIVKQLSRYGLSLDRIEIEKLLGLDEDTLITKKEYAPILNFRQNIKRLN